MCYYSLMILDVFAFYYSESWLSIFLSSFYKFFLASKASVDFFFPDSMFCYYSADHMKGLMSYFPSRISVVNYSVLVEKKELTCSNLRGCLVRREWKYTSFFLSSSSLFSIDAKWTLLVFLGSCLDCVKLWSLGGSVCDKFAELFYCINFINLSYDVYTSI